jgi:hypothetical protein
MNAVAIHVVIDIMIAVVLALLAIVIAAVCDLFAIVISKVVGALCSRMKCCCLNIKLDDASKNSRRKN